MTMRKIPYDIYSLARIRPGGRDDAARIRDSAARGVDYPTRGVDSDYAERGVDNDYAARGTDIDSGIPPQHELTNVETALLRAVRRQGLFQTIPFSVAATPILVRQSELRTYFLIHNTGINPLYIGFDTIPTAITGLGIAAGGFGEPFQVPSNDIWVVSNAIGTTGILIVSVEN